MIRWNIQRKLNAVLTLCGLLFIGVSAPVISYFSFAKYQQDALSQQARLVGAVRTSAAIASFVANDEIASEVLQGLLQDDEIRAVEIRGKDGFMQRAQSEDAPGEIVADAPQVYSLFSPVNPSEQVGAIHVWPNSTLISARARASVVREIALLIGLTLMLALVAIFATHRLVGRPLRHLADQVETAKPGSHDVVQVGENHLHDEIGMVTTSVNAFLAVTRNALQQERTLRERVEAMHAHFDNIFASSHVGIMVLDERGVLLQHNPVLFESIVHLNERSRARVETDSFFDLAFSEPEAAWSLVDMARTSGDSVDADLALKGSNDDESAGWVHCILSVNRTPDTGKEAIECVLYDVTKRVNETQKAKELAERDPLTGLYNRRGCEQFLAVTLQRQEGRSKLVAMVLDLDGFKPVNDRYGHAAGDKVLNVIAKRLQAEVRANIDLVGRIGGDEFIVFIKMRLDDREAIANIAQKMINKVSQPINVYQEEHVNIGVSIGIAFASDYDDYEALIEAADAAMYDVKMRGKNDFAFANP